MTAELVDYTTAMADFDTRAGERLEGSSPDRDPRVGRRGLR